jgi:hypothetical protein
MACNQAEIWGRRIIMHISNYYSSSLNISEVKNDFLYNSSITSMR